MAEQLPQLAHLAQLGINSGENSFADSWNYNHEHAAILQDVFAHDAYQVWFDTIFSDFVDQFVAPWGDNIGMFGQPYRYTAQDGVDWVFLNASDFLSQPWKVAVTLEEFAGSFK